NREHDRDDHGGGEADSCDHDQRRPRAAPLLSLFLELLRLLDRMLEGLDVLFRLVDVGGHATDNSAQAAAYACAARVNVKGISGSGKTTFSRELAERLSVPYLELDAIHHGPN